MCLTPNRLALAICLYFAVLSLSYARALPLFEATDEAAHFLYIHNFLNSGQLPVLGSREQITNDPRAAERWSLERHQPPLYYLIGAALVSWTKRADIDAYLQPNLIIFLSGITAHNANVWLHPAQSSGDTATAAWVLRLYSLALGIGTLWLIYLSGKLAFGVRAGLLAMLLVASLPTFLSISSSINNDNLVTLLYTAGVYWSLRVLKKRDRRSWRETAAISLILAGAALSKLTGLTLFGVVYLALLIGVLRGRLAWQQAAKVVIASLVTTALIAGWWYVRNWSLYGDPLAARATSELMGRAYTVARESGDLRVEIQRVWQSFWLGVGHLHALVYGPGWLYVYALGITLVALVGLVRAWLRRWVRQDVLLLLLGVMAIAIAALIAGTRDIDISYGRILFPALAAFAPLLAVGWGSILRRGGSKSLPYTAAILILPLAVMALVAPVKTLPDAYPTLTRVDALPSDVQRVDAQAGGLTLLGYQIQNRVVSPGDDLRLWLYLQGRNASSPALVLQAQDMVAGEGIVGSITAYPGQAAAASFDPQAIYRVPLVINLAHADQYPFPANPSQMRLNVALRDVSADHALQWQGAAGKPLDPLLLPGPVLLNPDYHPPAPQVSAAVTYGDTLRLEGYTLKADSVAPGGDLGVISLWTALKPPDADWTMAMGLLDDANNVVVNADHMPFAYPTSVWLPGVEYEDRHFFKIPPGTPPGDYRLYIGWYRLSDGERLTPVGANVEGTLYIAPTRVKVIASN